MSRIVFITQQFDPEDPLLASVVPQVAAIARRVDEVVVIADGIVKTALPANARAHSFRSRTQLGRGLKLLLAVGRELPGLRRNGAVVAHMVPLYAIVVAPLVRPARVPLLMWWSHWKIDRVVRLAERLCTTVVTVGDTTFPMASNKVVTVGQAIDVASIPGRGGFGGQSPAVAQTDMSRGLSPDVAQTDMSRGLSPDVAQTDMSRGLSPDTSESGMAGGQSPPLRVLVVGRYSPAKGVGTIVEATRIALESGAELRLDIYGPTLSPEARAERERLQRLVIELELTDRVHLGGSLTRTEVIALLANADLLVNNAPGGADRIVYEAGAAGIPVLASNPANANVLEPDAFYHRDDAEGLATKIGAIAAMSPAQRDEIGEKIRARVVEAHSVDSWADGLLAAAGLTPP